MAGGTNRPNGQGQQINVKAGASQFVKAPNSMDKSMKPQVVTGGDLRARGSQKK